MVVTTCPLPLTPYPELFQQYVQWGMEHLLEGVEQWEGRLAGEARERALHLLSFGLQLESAWQVVRRLLLALAPYMEQEGAWQIWLPYLEQGHEQSRLHQDRPVEAAFTLHLGLSYRSLAKYTEARQWLQQSAVSFGDLSDWPNQAKVWNALGFLERLAGNPQAGAEYGRRALALLSETDLECATSYGILGAVAFDQRNWVQASHYFQQALALCEQHNHQRKLAWALEDLAAVRWAQGVYGEAAAYYQRSLDILQVIHAPIQQAVVQMNLGGLYLSLQQPEIALTLLAQAEPTFQQAHDQRRLAIVHSNQGIAYRYLNRGDLARSLLLSSIERARQIGYDEVVVNALDELGLVYRENHELPEAIQTFHQALAWLPRLGNQQTHAHYLREITTHLEEALTVMGTA